MDSDAIVFYEEYYLITHCAKRGSNLLESDGHKRLLLDNINFFRARGLYQLAGYVILPDHYHLLISPAEGRSFDDILVPLTAYVTHHLSAVSGLPKPLFRSVAGVRVVPEEKLNDALNFLHENPVRHGQTGTPKDYGWSSYANYYLRNESLVQLDRIPMW
ncbi:MAG TPA: hypothetical protein PL033_03805 [Candidatus Brocadiia bacterium]|nr:hypothetical protein [Candidatus Brocadiia bacterium]